MPGKLVSVPPRDCLGRHRLLAPGRLAHTRFFGLDVLLIYIAFKLNYRAGRIFETVQLSETELVVRRVSPGGKVVKWIFQPFWVRVKLSRLGGENNRLTPSSHNRYVTLGRFLTSGERQDFAEALRLALRRQGAIHPA